MNWLDIIVILMLVVPTFIGLRRGLVGTVIPMIGIVLGVIVAGRSYNQLSGFLDNWLNSDAQIKIVGFIIIFVLFMAAAYVVASMLRKFLSILLLGWVDRLGGAAFGLITGGIIAGAMLSLITHFFTSSEETMSDSALAAFLLDKFPLVLHLLPREFDAVRQIFS